MENPQFYGNFEERGFEFNAFINYKEFEDPKTKEIRTSSEWIVKISKDGALVKELKEPMIHFPLFGVDVDDHRALEEITENFLKENLQ